MPSLNFTRRVDIPVSAIDLLIEHAGTDRRQLTAKFDFDELGLPAEALVLVEAQYRGIHKRFDYGVVGNLQTPPDRGIAEFPTHSPTISVTVVDPLDRRILAARRNLRRSKNRGELLPVVTADLGQTLWRLNFEEPSGPVLEVTNRIAGIETTTTFHAFVLPAAFRSVLRTILLDPDYEDGDEAWQRAWVALGTQHAGDEPPDPAGENREIWLRAEETTVHKWIEGAVLSFADKHHLLDEYRRDTGGTV